LEPLTLSRALRFSRSSFFMPATPMPAQFRVYIVRHGETEWNRIRRLQGQLDVPLNETGLKQAMLVAEALKDVPFVRAFCSDLQRASKVGSLGFADFQVGPIHFQTAECILQYHPDTVLQLDELIRERVSNAPSPASEFELTTRMYSIAMPLLAQ